MKIKTTKKYFVEGELIPEGTTLEIGQKKKGSMTRVWNEGISYWTVIEVGKTTRWGKYDDYERAEEHKNHLKSMNPTKEYRVAVDDNGILKNEYGEPINENHQNNKRRKRVDPKSKKNYTKGMTNEDGGDRSMKKVNEAKRVEIPELQDFKDELTEKVENTTPKSGANAFDMVERARDIIIEEIESSDSYDYDVLDFGDSDWADEDPIDEYSDHFTLKLDMDGLTERTESSVDVYNSDLVEWLSNDLRRAYYVDEVIRDGATELFPAIMQGQYREIEEYVQGIIDQVDGLETN